MLGVLYTVDHKKIGRRYLVTAFVFLLSGRARGDGDATAARRGQRDIAHARAYNQLFTMHGIDHDLLFAAPVFSGFGNFLLPLMIGARDMAFPRLNAFSYWVFCSSGLFMYASLLVGRRRTAAGSATRR